MLELVISINGLMPASCTMKITKQILEERIHAILDERDSIKSHFFYLFLKKKNLQLLISYHLHLLLWKKHKSIPSLELCENFSPHHFPVF